VARCGPRPEHAVLAARDRDTDPVIGAALEQSGDAARGPAPGGVERLRCDIPASRRKLRSSAAFRAESATSLSPHGGRAVPYERSTPMRMTTLALLAALAIPTAAAAQQRIGIMVVTQSTTTPGVACSFDCNDPNNTRVVS